MSNFPTIQQIVLSENGNQVFQPRDTITIMLDPQEIGVLNGKDSYLRFNVKLSGDFKAELDRAGGGGFSIVDSVSIWNGNGNTLIEQLNDMPVWMGTKNFYDKTSGLENKRNLLEGLPTNGNHLQSAYFRNTALGSIDWTSVECCLPIYQSGCLYGDSVLPVAALNGIMIKIQLSEPRKAIRSLQSDGFVIDRTMAGLPVPISGSIPLNLPYTKVHVPPAGEGTTNQGLPVCYELAASIVAGPAVTTAIITADPTIVGVPVAPVNVRANVAAPTVAADFPWVIGQTFAYIGDAGTVNNMGAITNITFAAPNYTLTFAAVAGLNATLGNHSCAYVQIQDALTASYVVSDVQLVCSVVQPDPRYFQAMMTRMKSGGGYSFDIRSFNLYRNNLSKTIAQSQELIPCTEFRARGLLEAAINPTVTWNTSWALPLADYMRNYQYVLGNVNTPLLAVESDKEFDSGSNSWNGTLDEERLKCLEASKITVRNELHPSGRMVFGREVSKRGYSSNLNTTEVRLNQAWGCVDGTAGTVQPQFNKILDTYVHHFRRVTCRPDQVVVDF
jgi:hypothetical protein